MLIDRVPCDELAKKFDTPLYVLSENRIRRNYRGFYEALVQIYPNVLVCPAYKANSHHAICRLYEMEGAGAEVVSYSELRMALDADVAPHKIVYNGPLKKKNDLELAISSEVGLINADSLPELDHMQEAAHKIGKKCNVGIRVNIGINPKTHPHLATSQREHKFGIWREDAVAAYKQACKGPELNVVGIHCHIGSNISEPGIIRETATQIFRLTSQIRREAGLRLSKIDFGGGLGFPYQPTSPSMTFNEYASSLLTENIASMQGLQSPTVIFEPGRAIVADSGILLTTVEVVKKQGAVNWAIVDAGMNTFIRPALYEARHQVVLANRASNDQARYNIGGPCCESADAVAKDVVLPTLRAGDVLAILDVGAYGFTMSSNYNGQPRPAVVLISEGHGRLIRSRERYEDMVAAEIVPSHLTNQMRS